MDNALMVLLALEKPPSVEEEKAEALEDAEKRKHREDMEKMMVNLAKSSARQEVAIATVSGEVESLAKESKSVAKAVKELKKPSAYDMEVLRDEKGLIYKIEVKAK